jgi:hypothetical protein
VAGKGKAVGAMIKYGPILIETSRRYGPRVWDQVKAQKEPAERYVQDKVDKGNQRKKAVQHADTVIDGSVLRIFHRNLAHWVVFSGDEPIAVHPRTSAPFRELLKNADLSKRTRPEDEPALRQRLRASARRRTSGTRRGSASAGRQHARADVNLRRGTPPSGRTPESPPSTPAEGPPAAEPPPSPSAER